MSRYPHEKPLILHFTALGATVLLTLGCLALWKCFGRLQKFQLFGAFRQPKSRGQQEQMQKELSKARQKYAEAGTMTCLLGHAILSVLALAVDISSDEPWHSAPWYITWSISGVLLLIMVRFPVLHNFKGVPVSYMVGVLMLSVYSNRVCITKQDFMFVQSMITTMLIVISPVGGMSASTLGTLFYSGVSSYSFCMAQGESEIGNVDYVTGRLSMGVGSMLVGTYCMIGILWNSVHSIVERKAAVAEREAVSSLLILVCDAVVELDEHGRIVSPSLDLSNLLLRSRSKAGALQDRKLQDLLYTVAEKTRFESFMEQSEDPSKSSVGHFDLRDAWDAPVRMEIFKVVLASSGGSGVKYLMGIKEHSDFDRVVQHSHPPSMIGELVAREPEYTLTAVSGQSSGAGSEGSEDVDGDSSRHAKRVKEGSMPTCQKAIDVSLLLLMDSWKCRTRVGRFCCSFHAAAAKLALATARLKRMRCNIISKSTDTHQCSQCGIEESTTSPFCCLTEHTVPDFESPGATAVEVHCSVCEGIEQFFPKAETKEDSRPKKISGSLSGGTSPRTSYRGPAQDAQPLGSAKTISTGSRGRRAPESGQGVVQL